MEVQDIQATFLYVISKTNNAAEAPVVVPNLVTATIQENPEIWEQSFQEAVAEIEPNAVVETPTTFVSEGSTTTNGPVVLDETGGLNAGAISGIVIGSIAGLGLIGVGVNEFLKRKSRGAAWAGESSGDTDFSGYDESPSKRRRNEDLEAGKPEDIDFIKSDDEGNQISDDLQKLEEKLGASERRSPRGAVEDLVPGGSAAASEEMMSASSSFGDDTVTAASELDIETVFAPAGKLGIVVDSSSGGPSVHNVRQTSPLLGIISEGDKIISIDDIDTTKMSAGGVTKLMASKATQKERKISFQKARP